MPTAVASTHCPPFPAQPHSPRPVLPGRFSQRNCFLACVRVGAWGAQTKSHCPASPALPVGLSCVPHMLPASGHLCHIRGRPSPLRFGCLCRVIPGSCPLPTLICHMPPLSLSSSTLSFLSHGHPRACTRAGPAARNPSLRVVTRPAPLHLSWPVPPPRGPLRSPGSHSLPGPAAITHPITLLCCIHTALGDPFLQAHVYLWAASPASSTPKVSPKRTGPHPLSYCNIAMEASAWGW